MEEVVGEYKCGRNYLDHEDVVDFWFPHTSSSITDFTITVSDDGFAWGVREILMHVLECDSSCTTCDGPTEYDCLSCATNQVVVDGDCVCDISSGYYNDSGSCVQTCSSTS